MAYFNHAFCKVLWGGNAGDAGFVETGAYTDLTPASLGTGSFAFFDQDTTNAATPWPIVGVGDTQVTTGQPLTLASTALLQNDRIGPFHGGYNEASKSKKINPRYVSRFYRVDSAAAQTNIIGVGSTPNLDLAGADANCCPEFFCNENYHLRVDLKGSPVLRMLNHNAYEVAASYTGCCDGPTPELVDPFDVMSEWATYIHNDPIFSGANHGPVFTPLFDQRLVNVGVTVTCDDGVSWDIYLPDNAQAGTAGLYFEADGTTPTAAANAFADSITSAIGGGAATVGLLTAGTGYTGALGVATTGGSGTGLTVNTTDDGAGGIATVVVGDAGSGYQPGDVITITGGGADATFRIDTVELFPAIAPISTYVSTFTPASPNCCAGLVMQSAFTSTTFDTCTFQPTDFFDLEPLLIQASMLDETGDPCVFEQLCISDGITPSGSTSQTVYPAIQAGLQAMGTGEQVLRDLILAERYNQNPMATDLRIREITQGTDITGVVNRQGLYTCYYVLHTVPRFNNPSGTFDNDQYLIKIPVEGGAIAAFETFMETWLTAAGNPLGADITANGVETY